jgi:hypothetical protein
MTSAPGSLTERQGRDENNPITDVTSLVDWIMGIGFTVLSS